MIINTNKSSGSILGGVLLITGCCIGAGMLGLPVLSAAAGFHPSMVMFFLSWLFMSSTALLLLEVNLWFGGDVSLITMSDRTLGVLGKVAAWGCFLFLFYALGVAYIAGSGELISDFTSDLMGLHIPRWVGSLSLCIFFAIFLYLGTRVVDLLNRFLMIGLIISYILLVFLGAPHVKSAFLAHKNWSLATTVLPIMIISFGYHNLIPSLAIYFKGDRKRLRLTVVAGGLLPLVIYLIWEWLILGLVPLTGEHGFEQALSHGDLATHVLRLATNNLWIVDLAQYFAFFAIVTSFLGNSLSFVDFLADGLSIQKTAKGKVLLCVLVILPPFTFAMIYPDVFLKALNYAGAFGAMILFGILPAAMAWSGRYHLKLPQNPCLPGGRTPLVFIFIFACGVIGLQIVESWKGG